MLLRSLAIKSQPRQYYILLAALFFMLVAGYLHTNTKVPPIKITKQMSAINLNTDFLKLISLGQERLLSDFFWITTLIESDIEHYKQRDLSSWMFLRFLSIIELDPRFIRAYQFGGKYLSIVKDDLSGAHYIFKRGLEIFPDDYELLSNYGFLLAFEIGDYINAIPIYEKLVNYKQAPDYYKTLLVKLKYEHSGNLELAYAAISDIYQKEAKDSYLRKRLESDLYAIKATIDLQCLNSGQDNCSMTDYLGDPYIQASGQYKAAKAFTPYQLHKKKRDTKVPPIKN